MFHLLQVFFTRTESNVVEHPWAVTCLSGTSCLVFDNQTLFSNTSYRQNPFVSHIARVYQSQEGVGRVIPLEFLERGVFYKR